MSSIIPSHPVKPTPSPSKPSIGVKNVAISKHLGPKIPPIKEERRQGKDRRFERREVLLDLRDGRDRRRSEQAIDTNA